MAAPSKPRGVLIAGNWKMNHGLEATERFFAELRGAPVDASMLAAFRSSRLEACVLPPWLSLAHALKQASTAPFKVAVGAQNVHWEKSGAFTGEVSAAMLAESGIGIALTGHSERRQFFGETDETVLKRTRAALLQGLRVILCIGETRAEREVGKTAAVLERQLDAVFSKSAPAADSVASFLDGRLVIAYEPVWAIGTGLTATPAQAEEAHQIVRKFLWDRAGMDAASRTPILYGGSVTPENARELLACANIDGALVGGASLKPTSFLALLSAGAAALAAT